MRTLTAICLLFFTVNIYGQDKQATRILDKLNDSYASYKTLEINFNLQIAYPERPIETQKGMLIQDGVKYVFKTPDQEIFGDGKNVWLYLVNRNEVQINNYEEDEDGLSIVTPKDLLRQYSSGRFEYALISSEGNIVHIEFKPLDDSSEYSKFRLSIRKNNTLEKVEAFGKDGSKIFFEIVSLASNKKYPAGTFTFNPSQHPGVFVEDLRID